MGIVRRWGILKKLALYSLVWAIYLYRHWFNPQSFSQSKALSWSQVWRSCKSFFQLCPLKNVKTSAFSFLLSSGNESIFLRHAVIVIYDTHKKKTPRKLVRTLEINRPFPNCPEPLLPIKSRLGAHPFIWKLVLFACEWKPFFFSYLASLW